MRDFQRENKLKSIVYSRIFLLFLGVVIISFFFSTFKFLDKIKETDKNKKLIENKIIELQKTKEKLGFEIEKLNTVQGMEENIRERFGLAKEGESMIQIIDDPVKEEIREEKGFLFFFKNLFK